MDKKEKVIRGLECCRQNTPDDPFQQCGACPYNINGIYVEDCRSVLSGDALEVLKELEPLTIHDPGAICPNCKWPLYPEDHPNYCGNCGKAVKWDESQ